VLHVTSFYLEHRAKFRKELPLASIQYTLANDEDQVPF